MKNKAAQQLGRRGGKVSTENKAAAARENGAKSAWKYKVVKKHRDMGGQWSPFPAAATFTDVEDAITYARDFAQEQREAGVSGTQIAVLTRGNSCVFTARVSDGSSTTPNGETRWE